MVAPCKAGGGSRAADKSSFCAGEKSAQESSLSPALARGSENRSTWWQKEHRDDTDGEGNAGVSKLRYSLVRGYFP